MDENMLEFYAAIVELIRAQNKTLAEIRDALRDLERTIR